jgi:hypothetical protein
MPSCIDNEDIDGPFTSTSWATGLPCDDEIAITWNSTNLTTDIAAAQSNWDDICPDVPNSGCCWKVVITTNSADITNLKLPANDPAATTVEFNDVNCKPICDEYETFVNFSADFFGKLTDFQDEDMSGDPCDVFTFPNAWFDPEDEGSILSPNSDIKYFNIEDVLTHEFGHLLGVPDETKFPSECPLNGIMAGASNNPGDLQNLGLPDDDDARCWFKQLYCPKPCTDNVAIQQLAPSFDLGQPYPSPLSGNILNVPYTIGTAGNLDLALFDVLGKQVGKSLDVRTTSGDYNYQFNCASLASGSYYVRLSLEGYPLTKRVEITH